MFSEQIVAIIDKLLENECITTNQHQSITSSFSELARIARVSASTKKDQFVD